MNKVDALIMLGAGGHAQVLAEILTLRNYGDLLGATTVTTAGNSPLPLLGDDRIIADYANDAIKLVNGIGQLPGQTVRHDLYTQFSQRGYEFLTLIHPAAWVSPSAELSAGVQVMAGAIVQAQVAIGANSIINTRASVDHHCQLGKHVHIAPGAVLCGEVMVGDHVFIGAQATVTQGVQIGPHSVIAAGAVVLNDLPAYSQVMGVPARRSEQ